MVDRSSALKPRKRPIQERSAHTVDAIQSACIQVLLDGGVEQLTTTRVAMRAGVSVGSLYQYFPHKQSLLASVLERHLVKVVEAVEAACQQAKGRPVSVMADALVRSFFDAKFAEPETSRALYAVAAELDGGSLVVGLTQRSQLALCDMLATASDVRPANLIPVSFVLSTSVVGPVQALLATDSSAELVGRVRDQVVEMIAAYLAQAGREVEVAAE